MNFFKLWPRPNNKASSNPEPRRNKKESFDKELLSFDLLFQLSYMSAVAASGIPRNQIFEYACRLSSTSSRYFRDVQLLCRKMGYDYPEACRVIAEATKEDQVRSLLLRLSSSLSSGEPETDFLEREAKVEAEAYGDEYERKLESLKKWTDAFAALIISTGLIIVVAVISTMIYQVTTTFIILLVGVMVIVSAIGAWIIYRAAPKEIKTLTVSEGSKEQRRARFLFKVLLPAAVVVSLFGMVMKLPLALTLIIAAALLFPVGFVTVLDDRKIDKRDEEIGTFLRSLGSVATAIGTTVIEAMGRMDLRCMFTLTTEITRLRTRLFSRIQPELCWHAFIVETGSELVNRSVGMFRDAIHLGGDAEVVGSRSSLLATKVSLLRQRRKLVSSTFGWLAIAMHTATIGLLIFIIEIVSAFGKTVESIDFGANASSPVATMGLFSFGSQDMAFIRTLLIPVILVMSGSNAFAPKAAEGGHFYKFFYFFSISLGASGLCLLIVPKIVSMIFGSIGT